MVTEVSEIERARDLLERERMQLKRHGRPQPSRILLGSMVEVPALLFQLDELMAAVDFVSVGSNDLLQYMTASDRGNTMVSSRFDTLSRPFLRALKLIVDAADAAGKPVTLCGEIAGRPLTALALVAIGFRSLSMSAASIGPVKAMLLDLDVGKLRAVVDPLLAAADGEDRIRAALVDFAAAEGLPV